MMIWFVRIDGNLAVTNIKTLEEGRRERKRLRRVWPSRDVRLFRRNRPEVVAGKHSGNT
jgi:hypothetical protein